MAVCVCVRTFLCGWSPDNVVSQRRPLPHAVSNVIHRSVFFNVRMSRHSIDVDIVAHVNLQKRKKEKEESNISELWAGLGFYSLY